MALLFFFCRNSKIIEVSSDQALSVINEARVKAVSSEDYSHFGVHLESGRIVFFKGDIFTEPTSVQHRNSFFPSTGGTKPTFL